MASVNGVNGHSKPIQIYDLSPQPGICPYVQRAKIVLKEKKLPYNEIYVDKANKAQDFLDLFRSITSNPDHRGTVPVIIDGDVKLAESEVVAEYLDLKYPDHGLKLYPTDPYKLALVRLFIINYTTQVQPAGSRVQSATTLEEYNEAVKSYTASLKILDTFLATYGDKSGDFLLGSQFSYAEAATLPFFYRASILLPRWRDVNIDRVIKENNLSHLQKWKAAGFARASVRETLPSDDFIENRGSALVKVPLKELK